MIEGKKTLQNILQDIKNYHKLRILKNCNYSSHIFFLFLGSSI